MDYIILDLEWNQAADSRDERSRMLTFEIIEIGAVKMNSRMEITDRFSEMVQKRLPVLHLGPPGFDGIAEKYEVFRNGTPVGRSP